MTYTLLLMVTPFNIPNYEHSRSVRSSMTLFDHIMPNAIFAEVLNAFYNSKRDELTIRILLTS